MAVAISVTNEWKARHPDALIGVLEVSGVDNTQRNPALEQRKRAAEAAVRARYAGFSRAQLIAIPVLADYVRYYKAFEQTYHVLLQLESIILKGKPLPTVSPLVDANFIAEIETLVLTAGHDVARLREPVRIDVAGGGDTMTQMNGSIRSMRQGDMVMRDAEAISCSILYGQDNRSPISPRTSRALYVAYAPPGVTVDVVNAQLGAILDNIRICAPALHVEQQLIFSAGLAANG
jgi:DNA/RNA-binding domain of Phe-tRNA-synthetase-like protein